MLLLHNYVCRSLKFLHSQAVRLKQQMAERGWQVRCPGKAVSLPSRKVPMTAGPQWTDSFPSWEWGVANRQADQLFPAHLVREQAGVMLQPGKGAWHRGLLVQVSLNDSTDFDSAAALLQLQVDALLANLFIPAYLVRGVDWTISVNCVRRQQPWNSFTGRFGTHKRALWG